MRPVTAEPSMNAARLQTQGPIGATVLETLSTLLAPALRRHVLAEALELEGAHAIPEDPMRARAFVEGPLRLVVKRRVGPALANFLVESLGPVFSRIESSIVPDPIDSPATRAAAKTERPASGTIRIDRNRMRLILASEAPDAATGLSRWLRQDVNVLALSHREDIVAAVTSMRPPWWLVIDLCRGPVDASIVTEIVLHDPDTRVFVWGELPRRFAHLLEQQGWESLAADREWTSAAKALRDRLPDTRIRQS